MSLKAVSRHRRLRLGVAGLGFVCLLAFRAAGQQGFPALYPGSEPLLPESVPAGALEGYGGNEDLVTALSLLERGEFTRALELARNHLARSPNSAPGHEVLGIALVLQGGIEQGLVHLERAVAINPGQSTAITKIGDVFFARGDRERAKSQFQQAVALNPADRLAHQRLGLIHEENQEFADAIRHYERGLAGAPAGYVGIKVNLARLYNRAGRFREAADLLTPVVPDDSSNASAHLALGAAWLGLKEPDQARAAFERARNLAADHASAHFGLGLAYRESGDLTKARQELERALELNPRFDAAALQLAETLAASDNVPEAIALLDARSANAPAPTALQNRIAELHVARQQYDAAADVYQRLLANNTADLRTYGGYATLLQLTGRLREARDVLDTAIEKYPGAAQARFRLGMHHALVQDYERAVIVLERAREMAPADPRIRKALSLAAYRSGNLARAITEARRLLQLVPENVDDRFYHASLIEESGDHVEAARLYAALLEAAPGHVGALNNLALIRHRQGQSAAALALAERAVQAAPDSPAVLDTLGWMLHDTGRSREALPLLQQAVSTGTPSPSHRYHLAVVLEVLGRTAEAQEQLQLALAGQGEFAHRDAARKLAERIR